MPCMSYQWFNPCSAAPDQCQFLFTASPHMLSEDMSLYVYVVEVQFPSVL